MPAQRHSNLGNPFRNRYLDLAPGAARSYFQVGHRSSAIGADKLEAQVDDSFARARYKGSLVSNAYPVRVRGVQSCAKPKRFAGLDARRGAGIIGLAFRIARFTGSEADEKRCSAAVVPVSVGFGRLTS